MTNLEHDPARLQAALDAVAVIAKRLAASRHCEDREIAEDLHAALKGAGDE